MKDQFDFEDYEDDFAACGEMEFDEQEDDTEVEMAQLLASVAAARMCV